MAGISTLASTVGAPITHTYMLDAANSTTGLMLSLKNDSGFTCILRYGIYIVTAASTGHYHDAGITTTAAETSSITDHTADSVAGYVLWSDGNDVIANGSYFNVFNVDSGGAAAAATGVVGYAIVQMWPVCSVV
jgi:hypothetical protein